MTYVDLHRKLNDNPFKPFRIRMVTNTVYDILEPWMMMIGNSSAVIASQTQEDADGRRIASDWKTVSIHRMINFSDIEPSRNGRGKRRRNG